MLERFGIFAKYWQPGTVKTRLATQIGETVASEISREFLRVLLDRFRGTADCRRLVFTPTDRAPQFAALGSIGWELEPQVSGDLGSRLRAFFQHAYADGVDKVVAIGCDSPTLPACYIQSAFELLERHSVVLGPARDGGYYLVGGARNIPPIFDDIAWSSDQVWSQTIDRLRTAAVPYAILPSWYDVDHIEDLDALRLELQGADFDAPMWRGLRDLVRIGFADHSHTNSRFGY